MKSEHIKIGQRFAQESSLGRVVAGGLTLNVPKLLEQRMLLCTNSGGGKSYGLRVLAEQMLPVVQTIILDSEGEFSTLREKHDVALIGEGGEADISLDTADKLAQRITELRASAIIDLYSLPTKTARSQFVALFLTRMLSLPKRLWTPMVIMLDEAHDYAPESGKCASTDPVISMMCQGRKRGICGVLVSQRIAKLHKDAISEANNMLLGRCSMDLDMRRTSDLLGFSGKTMWKDLRNLEPGEFFASGGAFEQREVVKMKMAVAKTTHPRPGMKRSLKPPKPSRAILKIAPELAALKQQAVAERNELAELRAEVAKLRKGTHAPYVAPREIKVMVADQKALDAAKAHGFAAGCLEGTKQIGPMLKMIGELVTESNMTNKTLSALAARKLPAIPAPSAPAAAPQHRGANGHAPTASAPRTERAAPLMLGKSGHSSGMRRMMIALAQFPCGLDRVQIGILSQLSPRAGSFRNNLSVMRTSGWIRAEGSKLFLTEDGRASVGQFTPLPTGKAMQQWWIDFLGGSTGRMLEAVIAAGGSGIDRASLADAVGVVQSGSFRNNLSAMRGLNLIRKGSQIVATPFLLDGRP